MGNPPIKITRTLLTFKTMTLKLHVKLKADNGKFTFQFHNETEYGKDRYVYVNCAAFISIDVVDKNNDFGFDKTKSLLINQHSIFQVIMFFRRLVKNMYKKDLFVVKGDELILHQDVADEAKELLQLGTNSAIIGIPAIIYDENETSYEGVNLFINKTSNVIPLTFTELETVLYTLEKIDLYQYSQLLLNYYVSYYKDEILNNNQSITNSYRRNKFVWDNKEPETVTANFSKETEDIMSGLPN